MESNEVDETSSIDDYAISSNEEPKDNTKENVNDNLSLEINNSFHKDTGKEDLEEEESDIEIDAINESIDDKDNDSSIDWTDTTTNERSDKVIDVEEIDEKSDSVENNYDAVEITANIETVMAENNDKYERDDRRNVGGSEKTNTEMDIDKQIGNNIMRANDIAERSIYIASENRSTTANIETVTAENNDEYVRDDRRHVTVSEKTNTELNIDKQIGNNTDNDIEKSVNVATENRNADTSGFEVEVEIKHENDYFEVDDNDTSTYSLRKRTFRLNYVTYNRKGDLDLDPSEPYNCPECSKVFDSKTSLLNHARIHKAIIKYKCLLCQEEFTTNEELKNHKIEHRNEDHTFLCYKCNTAYTDHCDYLVHQLSHTNQSLYKCQECTRYFKTKSGIKIHIVTHFNRDLVCDICSKTIKGDLNMIKHLKEHDSSFECVECGKVMKSQGSLDYHMISHTGVKNFQCLYCGKAFSTSQQRRVHTRIHTDERPYKCKICDDRFHQLTDCKRHMNTHKTEKTFKCDFCDKKYFHKESLVEHTRMHRRGKTYPCPECERVYQSIAILKTHMIFKHTNEKLFNCDVCNKQFKLRNALLKHCKSISHKNAVYGATKRENK